MNQEILHEDNSPRKAAYVLARVRPFLENFANERSIEFSEEVLQERPILVLQIPSEDSIDRRIILGYAAAGTKIYFGFGARAVRKDTTRSKEKKVINEFFGLKSGDEINEEPEGILYDAQNAYDFLAQVSEDDF